MSTKILIAPTTASHTTQDLSFSPAYGNVIGLITADLSGAEEIKIRAYHPARDGVDKYVDVAVMNATNLAKVIYLDALSYIIEKPSTINAVGVSIASNLPSKIGV